MSGVTVRNTMQKRIDVEITAAGNRVTVDMLLWFAREAEKAIKEGMDPTTEVRINNQSGVNGVHIKAVDTVVVEVP